MGSAIRKRETKRNIMEEEFARGEEKAVQVREEENRERYNLLQKREIEFMEREREQAESLALAESEIAARGAQTGATPKKHRESENEPSFRQIPSIESTLSVLLRDLQTVRGEIAELQRNRPVRNRDTPIPPARTYAPSAVHAPTFSFKDALESIPTFNGENGISVLKFARACTRVRDMFSPELESTLARLLRNKVKGRAYTAVEDQNFETISELTDTLKRIFGGCKTVNQYRGELGNIKKSEKEHIIDFIGRVKDLHYVILEGESTGLGEISAEQKRYFENETLSCFIDGLPPDFRMRLRVEGYNDLSSAYNTAIKIEKEIERDNSHFTNSRYETKTSEITHTKVATTAKTCDHCKKPGHTPETCWNKHPELRPPRNNGNDNNKRPTEGIICEYCSKPGHTEAQCYRKQNIENRNNSGNEPSRPPTPGAERTTNQNTRRVQLIEQSATESYDQPAFD